ncbi:hypothetical protein E2C01_098718 [Portunus trituberculatus]|uniref:Uncharacterized protein n=1 Tax=Portunus trituberculatus TaxID=210409 RepID=A0A5B7KCT5_PORTR|nr:hypothetical protein [Portunus trituberculatus]
MQRIYNDAGREKRDAVNEIRTSHQHHHHHVQHWHHSSSSTLVELDVGGSDVGAVVVGLQGVVHAPAQLLRQYS